MDDLARRIGATRLIGALTHEQLLFVLDRSQQVEACSGDIIINEQDENNHHVLLLSGELEIKRVWRAADGHLKSYTTVLKPRNFRGGFAYMSAASYSLRVRALSKVTCLLIDANLVDHILEISCQLSDESILDSNRAHLVNLFKQVSVVHQLPSQNLVEMIKRLEPVDIEAGTEVIKQGEAGDCYYMIESGEGQVWKKDPFTDTLEQVARLTAGDAFGEEALIQNGLRNASVKMLTPARLWQLHKTDFDALISPQLVAEIEADTAREKIAGGKVRLLDCRYDIEFEESRLPGSAHLPLDRLRWDIHNLNPEDEHIIYCRSGRRSKVAAFLMRERNFKAVSLKGGLKAWPYDVDMEPMY